MSNPFADWHNDDWHCAGCDHELYNNALNPDTQQPDGTWLCGNCELTRRENAGEEYQEQEDAGGHPR